MVDFVGHQAGDAAGEDGDAAGVVDVLVLDFDGKWAADFTADVKEGPAAFVLLVDFGGFADDLRVQQQA